MKLLVCTQEYPPRYSSGIGNVAYNVVEQLQKMGVHCTVCSPTGPSITLGSCSMIQRYGILGLLYYWQQVAKYFKERTDDYDVAWLHNPLAIVAFHITHLFFLCLKPSSHSSSLGTYAVMITKQLDFGEQTI